MVKLLWDQTGERRYETGVDRGVLYIPDGTGAYSNGVAWNGLVSVSEGPSGAEVTKQYADNIPYLSLVSAEQFGATIEAFTYPFEFEKFDGAATVATGMIIGQQDRGTFGLGYRTLIGDDLVGTNKGYKLKLVYGCIAAPTEKANNTVNETPEAMTMSWELSTTPVDVPGFKPTALVTLDSTKIPTAKMAQIETILYGAAGVDPRLPLPAELIAILAGTTTVLTSITAPTYNATTKVLTIPTQTGVRYLIDGKPVVGTVTLTKNTVVVAQPVGAYAFADNLDDDFGFTV